MGELRFETFGFWCADFLTTKGTKERQGEFWTGGNGVLCHDQDLGFGSVAGLARVQVIAVRIPKSGDSGYPNIRL